MRGAVVARVGAHREVLLDGELREDAAALGDEREARRAISWGLRAGDVRAVVDDAARPRGRGR